MTPCIEQDCRRFYAGDRKRVAQLQFKLPCPIPSDLTGEQPHHDCQRWFGEDFREDHKRRIGWQSVDNMLDIGKFVINDLRQAFAFLETAARP